MPKSTGPSLLNELMDRLIVPGALGFTRLGYRFRAGGWKPLDISLEGRTMVVTGATSGLGLAASGELARLGARVILVGRNEAKAARAKEELLRSSGNEDIEIELADLSLMSEVRALAERLLQREGPIHVLINNAAVLPAERQFTEEGLELTFATDLLSPYLLTRLLLPRLESSAPARVVNVLSGGMYLAGIWLEDLQNLKGEFDGARAYARAKRGLMLLTEHWAEQTADAGVVVNAMHPGWADTPGVETSLPGFYRVMKPLLRSPEEGADTVVWLAASPEAAEISGRFFLDREPHPTSVLPGTRGTRKEREALRRALSEFAGEARTP
jgi:NAD(P)-dependent dehydrogenase (short-subunit alcohol dehydrogenase family)